MKAIIIFITIFFLTTSLQAKESETIDLLKLNAFLANIYNEIKCPTRLSLNKDKTFNGETCIHLLTYDYENSQRILFYYSTYIKNNKYLLGFESMNFEERKSSLFMVLSYLGSYTGVTPIFSDADIYNGVIQETPISHIYSKATVKSHRAIRNFVINNGVIAVRIIADGESKYVACLDSKRKMHYKEGKNASILDLNKYD